jgi:hypothetical protein
MQRRSAGINDLPIKEPDRKFFWPLGRRPEDHPGLSKLDLSSIGYLMNGTYARAIAGNDDQQQRNL